MMAVYDASPVPFPDGPSAPSANLARCRARTEGEEVWLAGCARGVDGRPAAPNGAPSRHGWLREPNVSGYVMVAPFWAVGSLVIDQFFNFAVWQ